jgi:cytosine/adenosine deaminase-related metal-dependent hydrolase
MIWPAAVSLVNGRIVAEEGSAGSIRFSSRILAIGDPPRRGDTVVDLDGAYVLPGLVNAHDHLELNHYGRITFRDRYENATEWIDDMRPRLAADPAIRTGRSYPLVERVFIGALKNLLAGVTLVAHHNPFYRELRRALPIRVVRRYGWAHSFALERQPAGARGEPGGVVADRWRSTRPGLPFFVHLGEGIDAAAQAELAHLEDLGCLCANTVIVHGVAIDGDGWRRVVGAGAGLAWCPGSNLFLFGRTADIGALRAAAGGETPRVALCTDSRLSGSRDLLDELRAARDSGEATPQDLLPMVTATAADLVGQPRAGRLRRNLPADLLVIPCLAETAAGALLAASRRDVRLVTIAGRPIVGDPPLAKPVFAARGVVARPLCVDRARKLAEGALVRRIAGCPIAEPGVATW